MLLLALGFARPVSAEKPRIVVLPFSGPRGGAAAAEIRRGIGSRATLVNAAVYRRSVRGSGAAGRVAGAQAAAVSAIIGGSILRLSGRWTLRIVVYNGADGRAIGTKVIALRGTRLDRSSARRAVGAVLRMAARTTAPAPAVRRVARRRPIVRRKKVARSDPHQRKTSAADQPRDPPQDPAPPAKDPPTDSSGGDDLGFSVTDDAARRSKPPALVRHRRDTGSDDDDDDTDNNTRRQRRASKSGDLQLRQDSDARPSWARIVEVNTGLILLSRSFTFNDPIEPANPADYRTPGLVPAIAIDAAVYPLAALTRAAWGNIGLNLRYFRVLGLKSQVSGVAGESDTLIQGIEFGVRYRWNMLGKATSPTLFAGLDYGIQGFSTDESGQAAIPLPNISYAYLKLALVHLDVPFFVRGKFAIGGRIGFDYLLVFSAGDIEQLGADGYGKSSTGGIDVGGGVFVRYHGFTASIGGFYRRFFYSFQGDCFFDGRKCGNYAGGALDIYAGTTFSVGYSY
ncbi:MAG: hypothetical protein H6707_14050 [Deltaproteobacteria bacterium]|nr:hypothetical protein [Deltaproteobacteria bacterium]